MTTVEVLRKARDLLATGAWCQGNAARDKHGEPVDESDPSAVRWCALGACWHAGCGLEAMRAIQRQVGTFITEWNDDPDRTLAEVLDAFDRAIAAEEAVRP